VIHNDVIFEVIILSFGSAEPFY
jgi:hypothetical protein